jgi:large subunit ribosomal protein L37Ae
MTNARFGSRYGRRVRKRVTDIESKYKYKKQVCPFCDEAAVERISSGIYICNKCGKKFAGGAYEASTESTNAIHKYFDKSGKINKNIELPKAVVEEKVA